MVEDGEYEGSDGRGGNMDMEGLSTFFFTKFDDKWTARDLYIEYKELGDIDEVIIPPKKDK